MISGIPDQGNGGNRRGALSLHKPGHIVRGRDINPIITALSALLKLQVKRVPAIPDAAGNYYNDARMTVSETNAIIELYDAPGAAGDNGGAGNLVLMEVVSYNTDNDYLVASTDEGSFDVALPWDLRQDQMPADSTPIIWPPYEEGDIILAVDIDGGTGVGDLSYIDLNVGGRAWARKVTYKNSSCADVYRYVVCSQEYTS